MYSYKGQKAAVESYIKNEYNVAEMARELGHPVVSGIAEKGLLSYINGSGNT